jgi:hypothetical protein
MTETILDVLGPGILYLDTLDENALPLLVTAKRERRSFNISVMFDGDFTEHDVWPDGDAPEDWDATDVRKVIEECGWALFFEATSPDMDIYVSDASEGKKKSA